MPVDTTHPFYDDQSEDWLTARVSVAGEKAIRSDLTRYLPVPPGMPTPRYSVVPNGSKFEQTDRYGWYASFAEYPEIVAPTVEGFQGLIHEKDPIVKLPAKMQYLIDKATPTGQSLDDLWEGVTRELIVSGRQILVGEIIGDQVFSVPYHAESFINWRTTEKRDGSVPKLGVLRESTFEEDPKDEFKQRLITRYRELRLVGDRYGVRVWKAVSSAPTESLRDVQGNAVPQSHGLTVRMGAPEKDPVDGADEAGFVYPKLFGQELDFLPIDVGNAVGLGFGYGHIPILPMSKRALAIFRRSADYNRALYVKGDPQAVIISDMAEEDLPTTIGGSGIWLIPVGGDAKYMDIDGQGLPLMADAIEKDYTRFAHEAGRFLEYNDKTNPNESGRAVEKRLQSQRVTLRSLVIEAGKLMEAHLRTLGRMLGLSEDELKAISFEPNMDFTENVMSGQDMLQYVTGKNMGAPLSNRSLHQKFVKGGLTDMTYEQEMAEIRTETNMSGEPAPDPTLTTGMADGHQHTYRPGEARTSEADGHSHAVGPDGTISEADGHTHTPDPRAEDEDPKPEPTTPPGT